MASYGVAEAKNNFTHLLDRVQEGERITITKHGRPIAELRAPPIVNSPLTLEERRAFMKEFARRRDERPPLGMSAAELVRAMRDGDPE